MGEIMVAGGVREGLPLFLGKCCGYRMRLMSKQSQHFNSKATQESEEEIGREEQDTKQPNHIQNRVLVSLIYTHSHRSSSHSKNTNIPRYPPKATLAAPKTNISIKPAKASRS